MFSLIIAIVSIALIVALVALGGYFGGDAVSEAQAKTSAARLISEERQILASMDMFQADNKRWPTDVDELVSTGYLRSIPQGMKVSPSTAQLQSPAQLVLALIPSAVAADPVVSSLGWSMPVASTPIIYTSTNVPKLTCQAYNLASRGDNGILRQPFEKLLGQCYGADGSYQVVVHKPAAALQGVLSVAVEPGDMPSKAMDGWWDQVPSGDIKLPVDPIKEPKAELALSGAGTGLNFGQVQVGQHPKSSTVTLSNRGKVAAKDVAVQASGDFALADSTCGSSLGAGASCSFAIEFSPTAAQVSSGQVGVSSSNGAGVQSGLSGEGVIASATLNGINFGDIPANTSLLGEAILRNTGVGPLQLGGVTLIGGGFSVAENTCGSTLSAGAACSVKVSLTGVGMTAHTGTLTIPTMELGSLQADLVGQSRQAKLSVTPQVQAFGDIQVLDAATGPVVTVSNPGNAAVSALAVDSSTPGYTLATNTCASTLNAGASCSFSVKFLPTVVRSYPGSVNVSGSNGLASTVTLTGNAVAQSGAMTSTVDFGTRTLGSVTELTGVLSNTGKGPLTLTTVPTAASVSGTGYSFVGTTCTSTLAVNSTCSITVRFTAPATANTYTGKLTVTTAAGDKIANLTGVSAQQSITYSIGLAGAGASGASNGNAGGTTTVTYGAVILTATGGQGGYHNAATASAGGTASGGTLNVTGGSGGGASGDVGGGGGGGIGGAGVSQSTAATGSSGAQSLDVSGLKTAVAALYTWTGPGGGGAAGSDTSANANSGRAATGFGSGGGGAGYYGGSGGAGYFGGGGGGAAGYTAVRAGGGGGSGVVILSFTDATSVALTSGTSYTVPVGKVLQKIWAVGAGGAGGGATASDSTAGGGGGAGGVAYYLVN